MAATDGTTDVATRAAAAWRPLAVVAVGLAAYHNCFDKAFVLDDRRVVLNDPLVTAPPADPWAWLGTPRPLPMATFAVNRLVGGTDPRGYHAVNVAVHLTAALLLYDLTRRTLVRPAVGLDPPAAADLAAAAAVVWVAHPLASQAVTYVVQRMEAMGGLFALATVYAVLRAGTAAARPAAAGWQLAAASACLLGLACKESAVAVPAVALLYDRCFLTGSVWRTLGRRWPMHITLTAMAAVKTGLLLAPMISAASAGGAGGTPTVGFAVPGLTPWDYARTQFGVVLYYLRLAVWPHPLCIDYCWPTARQPADWVPQAAAVGLLLAVTGWLLWARPAVGFLPAAAFLLLAPTSTVVPVADALVEHRMYLPLAAVAVLAVAGGRRLLRAAGGRVPGWAAVSGLAAAGVGLTVERNTAYESEPAMWDDVLAKRPDNPRGRRNAAVGRNERGLAALRAGRPSEAVGHFESALAVGAADPGYILLNLADTLAELGRLADAERRYAEALALDPQSADAFAGLGRLLLAVGRPAEAAKYLAGAAAVAPDDPSVRLPLAAALRRCGEYRAAADQLREAVRRTPDLPPARRELGVTLLIGGRPAEAVDVLAEATRRAPADAGGWADLGAAADAAGDPGRAARAYAEAARVDRQWAWQAVRQSATLAAHPQPGCREPQLAAVRARQAVRVAADDPGVGEPAAAALAAAGHPSEARVIAAAAARAARDRGLADLAGRLDRQAAEYAARGGSP